MKKISYAAAAASLVRILTQSFGEDKARRCAEVILWTERAGLHFQGLLKLVGSEPLQNVKPKSDLEIEEKSTISALINAHAQPAFYATQVGVDIAIAKAKTNGIGLVGINNTFTSNGALGYYAERIAKEDLIGIVMARSPGAVAPFGTIAQLFGTNPLAVGFPTEQEPLVFDMATAAITWYELVQAEMRGETIEAGVAVDKLGRPTNDPSAAMDGGILPFDGGPKGSSIGMLVEIMSGPLVGSSYCDTTFDQDWGTFIFCLSPSLLADTHQFKASCSDLIRIIRAAPSKNDLVTLPGDRRHAHAKKVEVSGMIDVEDQVAALLGL